MTLRLVVMLVALATSPAWAGVTDTPLPIFADAQPAQLIATFQAAKHGGLDTDVVCTNLGPDAADVGVELFDAAGTRANTIAAGNGAVLSLGVGHTVTIGSGGTGVLHEDAIITLEAPVVTIREGSGRIVATRPHVGCVALAVDRLHSIQDPALCPMCPPPTIALLPFDVPSTTKTFTTTTMLGASSTTSTTTFTTSSSSSTTTRAIVTTTTSTTSTTLASCASTRGLEAVLCLCDHDLPLRCPATLLPRRLTVRIARICALGRRASTTDKPRRRQRLILRTGARFTAVAKSAASRRFHVPATCASTLRDAAARAALPPRALAAK